MCVGKLDNKRLVACKTHYVPDQRRNREVLQPLRCQALRRELTCLDREQCSKGMNVGSGWGAGFGQGNSQLLEFGIRRVPSLDMDRTLDLLDNRVKRAVRMVRRALITDCDMRLCVDPFQKDFANSRLADTGFTAQQRDLTLAGFGSIP